MQLKRVRVQQADSVAIRHAGRWVALAPAIEYGRQHGATVSPEMMAASGNLIPLLASPALRDEATRLIDAMPAGGGAEFAETPVLPFQPLSFRDFMLWEKHAIDATRGLMQRFAPPMYEQVAAHEASTGQVAPAVKPKKYWYERPIYYMGNHLAFIGEGATVPWPPYTRALDYELELGVVIARPIYNATEDEALSAIGGFTVINDFSARDIQVSEMLEAPFGPVKAKHFATGMGAVIVTADEVLPYVDDLRVEVRVDGRVWGSGHTAGKQHSLAAMVAYASLGEHLAPGELLATGTIPGCSGVETGQWLAPGDEIELEIERVGTLRNVIGAPAAG